MSKNRTRTSKSLLSWLLPAGLSRSRRRRPLALDWLEERLVPTAGIDLTPAASFLVANDWGSGLQAEIRVVNDQGADLDNWSLAFDYARAIDSIWNGQLVSHEGNHYVVTNAGWNRDVAAGDAFSFGFTAGPGTDSDQATGFVLSWDNATDTTGNTNTGGTSTGTGSTAGDVQVSFTVTSDWQSGFGANVTLQNNSTAPLTPWTLEFDFPYQITSIWNARIASHTGDHYVIEPADWNSTLAAGGSVSFGFNGSPGNVTTQPTNYLLNGVALDGTTPPPPPPVTQPEARIGNASAQEGNGGTTATAGFFHTSGNQLLDDANRPVKIAGVNWFGLETSTFAPHGLWARGYKDMMDQMKQLGFNTIRLPFSNQLFDPGSAPNGINFALNPDLQGLNGLQIMDKIVDYAGRIGLRILLDNHRSDAGAGPNASGLWYTGAYPESRWLADWRMLAGRYAGNPTVIGADLSNEPHGSATWGSGNLATDWRLAAERAGNAILAQNPDWLIFVEGVESYNGSNYWWGGNLAGARDFPVRLDAADRLVYAPHDYPASVYPQNWFSDPAYPNNLPAVWDANWGYLFRTGTAPVMLGEFGSKLATASDQAWADAMVRYLAGDLNGDGASDLSPGQLGISWTWWSWNPNSGDTGGILNDDWTTIDPRKVNEVQPIQFAFPSSGSSANSIRFTVSLSQASDQTVTLHYATVDGTATAGTDYTATTGTLTFAPGETQKTVAVTLLGDTIVEGDETVLLRLSSPTNATVATGDGIGTILDDDTPAPVVPSLSITDASVTEGNSGTTAITFTVSLSSAARQIVTVNYVSADDSATAGSDYQADSGTLTFLAGELQKSITILVNGDGAVEGDESLRILLSGPANATIARGQAVATIRNDDTAAPTSSAVQFTVRDDWGTGFVADLTITNQQATALNGWTLEFDFDRTITSIWNAEIVSQVGNHYVIRSMAWNAAIAAGASVTIGFQGSPGNVTSGPSTYVLNGQGVGDTSGTSTTPTTDPPAPPPSGGGSTGKRVVAYFTEWSIYDRGYTVANIPAGQLTDLIYAFAQITPTGEMAVYDTWAALEKPFGNDTWDQPLRGNFHQLQLLKAAYPDLHVLIAVGGWTLSGEFSNVALTPEARAHFAASAVELIVGYGFDGIDIDWEYPGGGGLSTNTSRPEDKQNYTLLLAELRRQFDAQSALDGKQYFLTAATAAGADKLVNFDLAGMSAYVDWFNVMTYDYHGTWENSTNHQAPLYASPSDPSAVAGQYNVDWTLPYYLASGVSADKILLGVPLYTRAWSGVGSANNGLYQSAGGAAPGTWEAGSFDYRDLHDRLATQPDLYFRYWDSQAQTPYVYSTLNGGMFSTYEDAQSVQAKLDYVLAHDLGGMFFWELSADVRDPLSPDSLVGLASGTLKTT